MSAAIDLLSPDRITAVGTVVASLFGAWLTSEVRKLKSKVAELETEREKDQGVIKAARKYIRERIAHSTALTTLLQQHAPGVVIPPAPAIPAELEDQL